MPDTERKALIGALIALLDEHDPQRDLSFRAEGTAQAIEAFASTATLSTNEARELANAIIRVFVRYKQHEIIGRGANAEEWPTNRFALSALETLGIQKPGAKAVA